MKIFFHENKAESRCGTNMLLKHLLRKEKIEVIENPQLADFIFVSLYDVTCFQSLKAAKKYNKQVVAGGDVAKLDFILNYADYVVKGEAYKFIEELGKLKTPGDIIQISNVWTKEKKGNIDYKIEFNKNPIVKAAPKVLYYYGGKGCQQRCKFCFYSWANEYSIIEKNKVLSALNSIKPNERLYLTCAYFPYPDIDDKFLKKLGMIDLKNHQYLKRKYPSRTFRMGIEFFKEETRKLMGKPIANEKITETINRSLEWNHEITMYFIVGLEKQEDMFEFIEHIPEYQKTYSPRVTLHFQYIDFNQLTPLADFDVRIKSDFDYMALQRELNKKNRRVRVGALKYKTFSNYRTLIQRIKTIEEAEFIYNLRNEKNNEIFIENVEKKYSHLLGTKTNIHGPL